MPQKQTRSGHYDTVGDDNGSNPQKNRSCEPGNYERNGIYKPSWIHVSIFLGIAICNVTILILQYNIYRKNVIAKIYHRTIKWEYIIGDTMRE